MTELERAKAWASSVISASPGLHNNELYDCVPDELYPWLPDALDSLRKRGKVACANLVWYARDGHWAVNSWTRQA